MDKFKLIQLLNKVELAVGETVMSKKVKEHIKELILDVKNEAINYTHCSAELKDWEILTFEEYKKMFYDTYFIDYYKSKKTGNLFSEKDLIEKYESYKSPLIVA